MALHQDFTAYATSAQVVHVVLPVVPPATSPITSGDALNPSTWTLLDPGGLEVTILQVLGGTSTFDLYLLEPLASWPQVYNLSCVPIMAGYAEFQGLTPEVTAADSIVPFDVANVTVVGSDNAAVSTLKIGPDGDYANESGRALLEKLIMRRLTTPRGGFFHLPNYGVGLQAKQLMRSAQLPMLRSEVQRQVSSEPDIRGVSTSLSWSPGTGVLTVVVRGTMASTGETLNVTSKVTGG